MSSSRPVRDVTPAALLATLPVPTRGITAAPDSRRATPAYGEDALLFGTAVIVIDIASGDTGVAGGFCRAGGGGGGDDSDVRVGRAAGSAGVMRISGSV